MVAVQTGTVVPDRESPSTATSVPSILLPMVVPNALSPALVCATNTYLPDVNSSAVEILVYVAVPSASVPMGSMVKIMTSASKPEKTLLFSDLFIL